MAAALAPQPWDQAAHIQPAILLLTLPTPTQYPRWVVREPSDLIRQFSTQSDEVPPHGCFERYKHTRSVILKT